MAKFGVNEPSGARWQRVTHAFGILLAAMACIPHGTARGFSASKGFCSWEDFSLCWFTSSKFEMNWTWR